MCTALNGPLTLYGVIVRPTRAGAMSRSNARVGPCVTGAARASSPAATSMLNVYGTSAAFCVPNQL